MADDIRKDRPRITCAPNGPYLAQSITRLRNAEGDVLATKPSFALCRCGGSLTKPFCDGTHARNGFSGARVSREDLGKRDEYAGEGITIHDNRAICSHAGLCTEGLEKVFREDAEPWIEPGGASVQAIVEAVEKCPSGALSYSIGGSEQRATRRDPEITVSKDGPYFTRGSVELVDPSGVKPPSAEHFALCRCGASKNKPFCDGSHWEVKFKDDAR